MSTKQTEQASVAIDEVLGKSEAFVLKNKKSIIAAIVAVILIVGGSIVYSTFVSAPREAEAAEAIFPAQELFDNGKFEQALNGDGTNLGFKAIADEYSGTKSGNLAKAYAGISLAQLGQFDEAIDYLEDFSGDDQMVAPAVLGTLGNCYAQKGDNDAAIKNFIKAADKAENATISPYYMLQAGIIYESMGKPEKALDLYTKIKSEYPVWTYAQDIDKYINRVK